MNSPMQNGKISKRPPMQDNNYIGGVVVSKKNEKESTRDTRNGYLRNPRRREPERNEQRIMN